MKILILDDDKERHRAFKKNLIGNTLTHTYTASECIEQLKNGTWDICFLDHDLGGQVYQESKEGTGWEVAKWIHDNLEKKPRRVIIHSFNQPAAMKMKNLIVGSEYVPGVWEMIN